MERFTNWLGKVAIFLLIAGGSSAIGQQISGGGGGCTGNCTMGTLAIGGATIGSNALAVTGTANISGNVTLAAAVVVATNGAVTGATLLTANDIRVDQYIYWNASTIMKAPSDGVMNISNFAQNDFNRLQLGGTTSAFSAINRDGAGVRISAADGTTAGPLSISGSALTVTAAALGMAKMTASASAPGAAGSKLEVVCGTNAGTAKLIMYAGTSGTAVTVVDNVGTGVTGC